MSCQARLFINEDNDIILDRLRKSLDDTYVNDAEVTATLVDEDGVEVIGETTLSYIADSNGKYRGVFDQTDVASLTEGATYYVLVSFASGAWDGYRKVALEAVFHGAA